MFSPARWTTRVDAVELGRVDLARIGIPADLVIAVLDRLPHEPAHQMPATFERRHQRRADHAGGTCNGNDHSV